MIDRISRELMTLAGGWEAEANRRKQVLPDDPAAAGLVFCATALRKRLLELDRECTYLSCGDWGRLHGVSGQTVLNWIKQHRVPGAELVNGHWRIPRDAKLQRAKEHAA